MTLDLIRIPVTGATAVSMRISGLPRTGDFLPSTWREVPLTKDTSQPGDWWQVDVSTIGLDNGMYEYDFRVLWPGEREAFAPDPYAEVITRFGRYRSVLRIDGGHRMLLPFDWTNELPANGLLPNNNELIIYELPMRWVDSSPDDVTRHVGLGTFDKAIFERLACWQDLGINAIELLPVQDSTDTLNWGYGTRFFFAPDLDMGQPEDLKLFIKRCHQSGIRIILDVVMNHSKQCPLETLAYDMFYLASGSDEPHSDGSPRTDWGGKLFRYRTQSFGDFHARNFHFAMAEYWIKEYHVDGFRIDEFQGINNYDFIQQFHDHAWQVQHATFPGRPFLVIAEDSWRRAAITQDRGNGKIVDAIWDFDFRDEVRRLVADGVLTQPTQTSRSDRVRAVISGDRIWNDWTKTWRQFGFTDMAQRVVYTTSHDVAGQNEQRLLPYFIELRKDELVLWNHDTADANLDLAILLEPQTLLEQVFSQVEATFAIMLTAVGIPMFLAGEEFGDLHDLPHHDVRYKMSDPVDWARAGEVGHRDLLRRVRDLVWLRRRHHALHRNEIAFFGLQNGFHPQFDADNTPRVFAYCRTAGQAIGSTGQVIVIANCGRDSFPIFLLDWPWAGMPLTEVGGTGQPLPTVNGTQVTLALEPFQVRIFSTE